jgi:hypothetical protein
MPVIRSVRPATQEEIERYLETYGAKSREMTP